jgi:hypothetical protein
MIQQSVLNAYFAWRRAEACSQFFQLPDLAQVFKDPPGLLFIERAQRKTDADDDIIADICLWCVDEAYFPFR